MEIFVDIQLPATDGVVDCKVLTTDWSVLEPGSYRMDTWVVSGTSRLIAVTPTNLRILPAVTDVWP